MEIIKSSLGKIIYGLLFVVILPLLLFMWATGSEKNISLQVPQYPVAAAFIMIIGIVLMLVCIHALIKYGKGLPMNPFPPEKYVTQSIYKIIPHPIYIGFIFLCAGTFTLINSSSGLWLITPIIILGCVALVHGYEKIDLNFRFGKNITKPLMHLPDNENTTPTLTNRISIYFLVLIPWFIFYEMVQFFGIQNDAINVYFPFEKNIPVIEWTEIFYVATYFFVIAAPFVARSNADLRKFAINGLSSIILIIIFYLAIPTIAIPKEFVQTNVFGKLLMWERQYDNAVCAAPSFHVVWAFFAAPLYIRKSIISKYSWYAIALLISISCITTGMHAIIDVISAFFVILLIKNISRIWHSIRHLAEIIANSWKEYDYGWIRIINHGGYAAAGTFIGLNIIGILIGQDHIGWVFFIAIFSMVLSALWAQFIEGSPALLRPYGYYGGVLGVIVASFIVSLFGENVWLLLSAFCVAGPWIQSFGRLRCLVQGCCHGREASEEVGIKYFHPRSRVTRLANLKGILIHPTPVYSILWNILIFIIMLRLWLLSAQLPLIAGLYLILTGIGRFVEEAYRGEPQTPIYYGLRLYQWVAVATVIIGAIMTTVSNVSAPQNIQLSWFNVLVSFAFGLLTWFSLGVDFPKSNKRFARLV